MDWIEVATGVRKRIKREIRGEKYEYSISRIFHSNERFA
jgi:hypothetical protein